MNAISTAILGRQTTQSIFFDVIALAFIYFVPALSHVLNLPVYLIEPMRVMLILALVHTTKQNAYAIAFTLPLFSFLISAHPVLPKAMLMAIELLLNVFLFYFLMNKWNAFISIFLSILLSKLIYYGIKYLLIQYALLESGLISTPLLMQGTMTLILSGYLSLLYRAGN